MARRANEYAADAMRTQPGRFGLFDWEPLPRSFRLATHAKELAFGFMHATAILIHLTMTKGLKDGA